MANDKKGGNKSGQSGPGGNRDSQKQGQGERGGKK